MRARHETGGTGRQSIGARILTPGKPGGTEVAKIYAGDRVSDLLNEASDKTLLVTNLANLQMLRVAELMEVPGICFVDGVEPDAEIFELARENGTLLMVSPAGVFETCGLIYQHAGGGDARLRRVERLSYDIHRSDFAGPARLRASLKEHLKRIGAERRRRPPRHDRRLRGGDERGHPLRGRRSSRPPSDDGQLDVDVVDDGPGIPDVEQAMREGFSTATAEARALGFGAGMGLPNIRAQQRPAARHLDASARAPG